MFLRAPTFDSRERAIAYIGKHFLLVSSKPSGQWLSMYLDILESDLVNPVAAASIEAPLGFFS